MFSLITLKCTQTRNIKNIENVSCFKKELTILRTGNSTTIIDPGTIGSKVTAPTWVNFTLVPSLIKSGINNIDNLIILKPSSTVFKAVTTLIKKIDIKNIYLVSWSGELNNTGWANWQELLSEIKQNNINFVLLEKNKLEIDLDKNSKIKHACHIIPEDKIIKKNKLKYNQVTVSAQIDQKNIAIQNF